MKWWPRRGVGVRKTVHFAMEFSRNIFICDEKCFRVTGFVNKQNFRNLWFENSRLFGEFSICTQWVTVWCSFWDGELTGPYFLEHGNEIAVTGSGVRYREKTDFKIFMMWNWLRRCGRRFVETNFPTRRRYMSQYQWNHAVIARNI